MAQLDFDFTVDRLGISAHPFCGDIPEDVRTTTRYDENELLNALFGVIHETDYTRYEQSLPHGWSGQPIALVRSVAVHESQSLFFEMQLGRSKAFLMWLIPTVTRHFGDQAAFEENNFITWNQQVRPESIRVSADEVSYPARVILRYETERALINGDIEVDDIPALRNEEMQSWLGLPTIGNYRDGRMQDIHWVDGGFDYFPSCTLGAMYAAQSFSAANRASPDLNQSIAQGEFDPLFDRLCQNIRQHGNRFTTEQLITQATDKPFSSRCFRAHLETRYL